MFQKIEEETMTKKTFEEVIFTSPHSAKAPAAHQDPNFEVNSSIKQQRTHFLSNPFIPQRKGTQLII